MNSSGPESTVPRHLPWLLLLFGASGCSALIYEVVWYQMLQLAIGSTSVSLGILLATFMGGLCVGSLAFPRFKTNQHPLRIYAVLEAGIGVLGLIVLFGLPVFDWLYVAGVGLGLPGMVLRCLLAAVCMLVPTILMGASLPAIVRSLEDAPRGVAWWGVLYGVNTTGAILGCVAAGFYLLRVYNVAIATYAAVAINFAVAGISYALAAEDTAAGPIAVQEPESPKAETSDARWTIYTAIGISGATALGAEVVWTRLLAMLMGSTTYVFSIILAVFLFGLAIGSLTGASLSRLMRPRLAFGWSQILLVPGIAWTAYMIAVSMPYWPINPMMVISPWHTLQLDLVRCLWAILPAAFLWGASFPLALACVADRKEDPAKAVGSVYAANTLGAIAGALIVSLVLVPWIGTHQSQRVLLVISVMGGLLVLLPSLKRGVAGVVGIACVVLAVLVAISIQPIPGELIAYGRRMSSWLNQSEVLYTVEGRNSSVAITRWNDGALFINVNGHVEATTEIYDMKLQRMVGHLAGVLHPNPKSVLGIGFGAGVSAGSFTRYPGIEHITVCEIEPVIPPTSTKYLGAYNYNVMLNPKARIIFDDARHYLMTARDKYDIIASDPLDVFAKGTAALYSKEYFESVKRHLNPGGIFTLYVPLYETDERTIRSELATFFAAFPEGTVWANTRSGQGYDMVFMGQVGPLAVDIDHAQQRLQTPEFELVAQSLREIGVNSAYELFGTYAGSKSDLDPWLKDAEISTDTNLRLQYIAGWGINSSLEDVLYRQILRYRRLPGPAFKGSPEGLARLEQAIRMQ